MNIFHIARVADWEAARTRGRYEVSTLGRTLAEEDFIHAARTEQVQGVFDAFYRGRALDLVLLRIDTDLLDVPWSEDPVPDQPGQSFPHVHGPLRTAAVTQVAPLDRKGRPRTFRAVFFRAMFTRFLAVLLMLVGAVGGAFLGAHLGGPWVVLAAAIIGAAIGGVVAYTVVRLPSHSSGQFFGP